MTIPVVAPDGTVDSVLNSQLSYAVQTGMALGKPLIHMNLGHQAV